MPNESPSNDVESATSATTIEPSPSSPHPRLKPHKQNMTYAVEQLADNKNIGWGARRALLSYYREQHTIIDGMNDMEKVHAGQADFDMSAEEQLAQRALNISFASNIILLGIRAAIAAISGSLSLIIALMDAVLDVLSSCMMYYAAYQAKKPKSHTYPVGKHRLEPLGIIVFSCVMATAAVSVVVEGIKQLVEGGTTENELPDQWIIIGGTLIVLVMKVGALLYCRRSKSPSAQAFALDHLNDIVVNSSSLAGVLLGAYVAWWTDPAIAILISFWVMWAWGRQGWEQIKVLIGVSAPPAVLQKLTYLALHHRPEVVREIDTVRAYTAGTNLIAEVDIVLDPEMKLKEAHDVGEELQIKLESLPEITRAFVHLDIDSTHKAEH